MQPITGTEVKARSGLLRICVFVYVCVAVVSMGNIPRSKMCRNGGLLPCC